MTLLNATPEKIQLSTLLGGVLDSAIKLAEADFGNIQLLDPDGYLKIVVQRGFPDWWVQYWDSNALEHGVCGTALVQQARVIVEDVNESPIFAGNHSLTIQIQAGVRAVQSTPILTKSGQLVGMLSTHYNKPHQPDTRQLEVIDLLVMHAAVLIDLYRSDELLRNVTENANVGLTRLNRDLVYLSANSAYAAISGKPRDEIVGHTMTEVLGLEGVATVRPYVERVLSGEHVTYESDVSFASAGIRYLHVSYIPDRNEMGEIKGWIACISDITSRRLAELTTENKEKQLRFVLEGSELGFWDWDIANNTVERNQRWALMLGYTYDEIKTTTQQWTDFIHPEDREKAWQSIHDVLEGRSEVHRIEYRMLHKDGSIRWILDQAKVMQRDLNGKPLRMCGTHSDITQRLLIEKSEREYAARLQLFVEYAPAALAMFDQDMRYLAVSKRWRTDYLLGEQDIIGHSHYEVFPEITEDWKNIHCRALLGEVVKKEDDKFIRANGDVQWVKWEIRPWNTDAGLIGGIVIFTEDITERKQSEEKLKLAALVYQNSNDAMAVTDAENRIIDINPAFTTFTGYTKDEVIGKNPKILRSGRQDEAFYHAMWKTLNETGQWRGEVWNRKKNGEIYAELLSINTIYNDDGAVYQRVGLFSDITDKKNADVKIWNQANYDQLTQLPNRNLFFDRLDQEIKRCQREGSIAALLFIDLDRFKDVNDLLGHNAGDKLLIEASDRIKRCIRQYDTVSRVGGDEFIIILSELQDTSDASRIAENVIDRLSEPFKLGDQLSFISASIGITVYPNDGDDAFDLVKKSDQAMYAAKNSGRSCFRFFTKTMQETVERRSQLSRDLRNALMSGQMEVYYQPIIDLSTGHIHKAEALLRWLHPEHGFVSPATFIPIAEENGTIHEIGDWVFTQAIRQAKIWSDLTGQNFQISVNMSTSQFKENTHGYGHWSEKLVDLGLLSSSVLVEITEGLLMNTDEGVKDILLSFRDSGIQVAIDDFGTGYSSLSYLKKFDIDYLKIDQLFTKNLARGAADFALCEAIVVMAHKLGIKVIAEGVETELQHELLREIGCEYGQGYLFSRPVQVAEFEKLLT
jgi:diguanylate cyclase (GGDEF)-like protein/PAS domain S-box-containing protein